MRQNFQYVYATYTIVIKYYCVLGRESEELSYKIYLQSRMNGDKLNALVMMLHHHDIELNGAVVKEYILIVFS